MRMKYSMLTDKTKSIEEQLARDKTAMAKMGSIEISALVEQVSGYWPLSKFIRTQRDKQPVQVHQD